MPSSQTSAGSLLSDASDGCQVQADGTNPGNANTVSTAQPEVMMQSLHGVQHGHIERTITCLYATSCCTTGTCVTDLKFESINSPVITATAASIAAVAATTMPAIAPASSPVLPLTPALPLPLALTASLGLSGHQQKVSELPCAPCKTSERKGSLSVP